MLNCSGHSAKYGTYTLMDLQKKKKKQILDIQLIQVFLIY